MTNMPIGNNIPDKNDFDEIWNEERVVHSQAEKDEHWKPLEKKLSASSQKKRGRVYQLVAATAVAASLLLLAVWYFPNAPQNSSVASDQQWVSIENNSVNSKPITLDDGSTVIMAPQSEILYLKNFKSERKVKFKGNAFFKVVKDAKHPFEITSGNYVTTVLGTSFKLESNEAEDISIDLYEGSVEVSHKNESKTHRLKAGQHFSQSPQKEGAIQSLFPSGKKESYFKQAPITEVLDFMQSIYHKPFVFTNGIPQKTVSIKVSSNESLEQQLRTLSAISSVSFEVKEDRVEVK